MAFTQAQIDAIDRAIASGELEVEFDDKRVKYRSMNELMQARAFIANRVAQEGGLAGGQPAGSSWLAEHSRD